jgi:hypothetical protein
VLDRFGGVALGGGALVVGMIGDAVFSTISGVQSGTVATSAEGNREATAISS